MLGPNAVMQSPNGLAARFEHEGEVRDEPHSIPSLSARIIARSLKLRHARQIIANMRNKGHDSTQMFINRLLAKTPSREGGGLRSVDPAGGRVRRPSALERKPQPTGGFAMCGGGGRRPNTRHAIGYIGVSPRIEVDCVQSA